MDRKELAKTPLFHDMEPDMMETALRELQAHQERFGKQELILRAGETTGSQGLVLEGSVTIESNDVWGSRTILGYAGAGQIFAETYALLPEEPLLVDVRANEDCRVLFLRTASLMKHLAHEERWAAQLAGRLLVNAAQKNLMLSRRSFFIAPKSIRQRVMAYLNAEAIQHRSRTFDIPFSRQQLADYLNVERTALSKELGKMQKEGYIAFRKSHFTILVSSEAR